MELQENEIEWLVHKVKDHLDGSLLSLDDILFYYKRLPPSVLYSGKAYRVIYHKNHENLNLGLNANKCFSKSLEALNEFVENQKYHNSLLPYKKFQCEIKGIEIQRLINFLNELNYEISNKFFFEEEIVAAEIVYMEELV